MTLGFVTTDINKRYHKAAKYHINGPKPSQDLYKAMKRMNDIEDKQESRKSRKTAFASLATFGKKKDRDVNVK